MLTFASTMKASTGRSMLASTHVWHKIHRRMYSSPELPRMPSGRTIPIRPPGFSQSTLRPKRRIRHDDIQASKRNRRLRWLEAREVPTGKGQRVHIEDIDGLIGFGGHAQTHRRGTNEKPIEVGAKEVRLDELAEPFPDGAELLR